LKLGSSVQRFQEVVRFLSRQYDPIHYGIERRAIPALNSQKVPSSGIIRLFTIIARNIDNSR